MTSTHIRKTVKKWCVLAIARSGIVVLSGAMFAANAMTLGELRGEALIGRALDLSIPFQSTAGEALAEGCVRADIYFGEAQQKSPRITIQASQLRLQLVEPVNEPVVKVQIRTFCGASQIRNYVLLADLPPDFITDATANPPSAASPARPEPPSAAVEPDAVVLPQGAAADAAKPGVRAPRKLAPSVGKNKKVVKKSKAKASSAKRPRVPKPASVQQAKSVLKLDPLEILSDRIGNLELNMPFVPAEDAMLQSRQIAALQAEVKSMRDLASKNDGALLELRGKVEQAQSQQVFNTLLYGLIALLLIGVAGLAWLLRGQKKLTTAAQSWWQHASDEDMATFLHPEVPAQAVKPGAVPPSTGTPTGSKVGIPPRQEDPLGVQGADSDALETDQSESLPTLGAAPLIINPEVVQDIRQQVEFFVSLGQDHRAIQILNQHIATSELPNPLLCMDLLGLYQHGSQAAEFKQLRDVCHQHFNVRLPDLADFENEGLGLASYPDVLTILTRLWPGEKAQAYLDTCIFRKPAIRPQAAFDLAAFRDLLTLHALVEELALPTEPPDAPADLRGTKADQPLARPFGSQADLPDLNVPASAPASFPAGARKTDPPALDFELPEHPEKR